MGTHALACARCGCGMRCRVPLEATDRSGLHGVIGVGGQVWMGVALLESRRDVLLSSARHELPDVVCAIAIATEEEVPIRRGPPRPETMRAHTCG